MFSTLSECGLDSQGQPIPLDEFIDRLERGGAIKTSKGRKKR